MKRLIVSRIILIILLCVSGMAALELIYPLYFSADKASASSEEKLFFSGWKAVKFIFSGSTVEITLKNPDPQAKIKSVKVFLDKIDNKLELNEYWFFDENGNPQVFVWDGKEGFIRSPEDEKCCSDCHQLKNRYKI